MNFCSHCGNKVVFKTIENEHLPRFVCESCNTIHYQNPKVIVGCIPIWEDKIMLCRRGIEPQYGFWNIPGGFLENDETVEHGAMREALEEAGVALEITHLQSIFSVTVVQQVHLHFLAKITKPIWHLTPETTEIQFFKPEDIPWNDIAFKSNEFTLRSYLADLKEGKQQTHIGSFGQNSSSNL
jgi:ADP-ribose pyrophosphatase YjhB (NUDIX family)